MRALGHLLPVPARELRIDHLRQPLPRFPLRAQQLRPVLDQRDPHVRVVQLSQGGLQRLEIVLQTERLLRQRVLCHLHEVADLLDGDAGAVQRFRRGVLPGSLEPLFQALQPLAQDLGELARRVLPIALQHLGS